MELSGATRKANLGWLGKRGFKVAAWLPLAGQRELRPLREIAARLMALDVVCTWVMYTEEQVASNRLRASAKRSGLERFMTPSEKRIWKLSRVAAHRAHVDSIGWRLENMWPLAWVLGFKQTPKLDGAMIGKRVIGGMITKTLPKLTEGISVLIERAEPRSLKAVIALEDRFYCCHNAVRSAQLGGKTLPKGFHPVLNGGVIHERRHALTWCLSPGVAWDKTDLST